MARKSSRVRWVIVLLVFVPIFTLVVLLTVEWSFVEVLQSQSSANQQQRDTPGRDAQHEVKIRAPRLRSPLANDNNKGDEYSQSMKDATNVPTAPETKAVFSNEGGTPAISESMPDLQLLKRRKKMEGRMENGLRELWWYLRAKFESLKTNKAAADGIQTEVQEQFELLNLHLKEMEGVSNSSKPFQPNWIYWQKLLSKRAETLLQKRLEYLQNPKDCRWSRQLVCNVAKGCGFGCQMHHVAYCFIMAYATERTLILESSNWRYCRTRGWGCVFKPISRNCTRKFGDRIVHWSKDAESAKIVQIPSIDNIGYRVPQLPMAVPRDLADSLMSFHGYPFVWFIGQFLKYLMQPNKEVEDFISERRKSLGFKHPIVGVHVRRTDKRQEAKYHMIEEYMTQVEEWYEANTAEGEQRRVFLATDDPSILQDARNKYPSYEFISDGNISALASKTHTRYSAKSLYGVIFDVQMLSECDYIVCTFSSQVCRLAYELMQTHHVDASRNFYSLDDIYYFGGQQGHDVRAVQSHSGPSGLKFEKGDLLGIAGNQKDGQSVGEHRKTFSRGNFPSYKVEEEVILADFPTYPNVVV